MHLEWGWVDVCLFVCPLRGFKTNGKKNADLCNDRDRFVLPTEVLTCLFYLTSKRGEACLSIQYWALVVSCCI